MLAGQCLSAPAGKVCVSVRRAAHAMREFAKNGKASFFKMANNNRTGNGGTGSGNGGGGGSQPPTGGSAGNSGANPPTGGSGSGGGGGGGFRGRRITTCSFC